MESAITKVKDFALEQQNVSGYICVDKDGLCIVAGGQASESMSGIIHQLSNLASRIEGPIHAGTPTSKESPVVRVDLERQKILIQSREGIATALFSHQK